MLLGILVGKIYWDSSSQALLWADCLSSQADCARSALQCKHHFPALVCLASGLFDRLHVLLNISSDAHFHSAVNVSLGCCLKIRSLKISSFNKKILLPEDPASNVLRLTVRAVDLWPWSCKSTGIPAHWLQGSARWAASSGGIQNGQLLSFFCCPRWTCISKAPVKHNQSCLALSGQLYLINYTLCCFSRQYTYIHKHTHTHTHVYAYGIYNCNFLKEAFKTVFSVVLCWNQLSSKSKLELKSCNALLEGRRIYIFTPST